MGVQEQRSVSEPEEDLHLMPEAAADRLGEARVALVTGASRGIGFALAEALAASGVALTIVARNRERLEGARDRLAKHGVEVHAVAADLQHADEASRVVAAHRDRFGRLDILVNNAGFGISAPIEKHSNRNIDLLLAVNLRSVVVMYREAMDLLEQASGDHGTALVVNVSSMAGKAGTELLSVYSAAKHGVVGFTQSMNRELADRGIKSCVICPAYVDTDLASYARDVVPRQQMIRTSDIAEMFSALLRLSRWCVVPEIMLTRPGDGYL